MAQPSEKPLKVDSTLSKGLMILETLCRTNGGKGVTELAKELDLTKSNTFRLLQSLSVLGYVKSRPDKSYAATLKAWQIGRQSVENMHLREVAHPMMVHLAKETGETIYLAVPENDHIIYIDKIESKKPIRSWNPIGGTAPIYCVGTGKAILAANYKVLRNTVKDALIPYTDKTLTTIEALDNDIEKAIKNGYAFDQGEFRERILSFGAAIRLPDGEVIAALGISMPDINLAEENYAQTGSLVAHAAKAISNSLSKI